MVEEFLLGMAFEPFMTGIVTIGLSLLVAYIIIAMVVSKLGEYLETYAGDKRISKGLTKFLTILILVSAAYISISQTLTLDYVSPVLNTVLSVTNSVLGMVMWGVYVGAIIFVGFAIFHHAKQTKGPGVQAQEQPQEQQPAQQYPYQEERY